MKIFKLLTVIIAVAILSVVSLSYAQRSHVSFNVHVGGGGYYGGGHYGGYNHHYYGGAPYVGVATGPIGYVGYAPAYYGPRPYGRCAWNGYYHQYHCW